MCLRRNRHVQLRELFVDRLFECGIIGIAFKQRQSAGATIQHVIDSAVFDDALSEEERRAREEEGWATLQRLSSVLAGGQRTGKAGENVLRESLAHLPPSMVVTDRP